MPEKSPLKFLSEKQISEVKNFHYNFAFDSSKEDEAVAPKNYKKIVPCSAIIKYDIFIKRNYSRA
jgi:hypothetical protein